jgi:hypothetical protein
VNHIEPSNAMSSWYGLLPGLSPALNSVTVPSAAIWMIDGVGPPLVTHVPVAPGLMSVGTASAGSGNSLIAPVGAITPIAGGLLASMNHMLPLGPSEMSCGSLPAGSPALNSWMRPKDKLSAPAGAGTERKPIEQTRATSGAAADRRDSRAVQTEDALFTARECHQ